MGAAGPKGADGTLRTKLDMYMVSQSTVTSASALCTDDNDILLHGGCNAVSTAIMQSSPLYADDPTEQAGWFCKTSAGAAIVAFATCISVQ